MTLREFLNLISDEELRIELRLDAEEKDYYLCSSFWLSDFRSSLDTNKYYADWVVDSISFEPTPDSNANIFIYIKEK